ncbi:MAG: linear amide C-N hydrolase [Ruminococcaceae bacterium]|nr:linear amide C-N hydrolase [Oscillospiraceae bacterium]
MCTALTYRAQEWYFGRTLDYEHGYGEEVTVTPRRFPLPYRHGETSLSHYAFVGMAATVEGYPLYYDGVNEHGLCVAGLRFAPDARYLPPMEGAENLAVFELIPRLLGDCRTVEEACAILRRIRLVDTPFSDSLPPAPLHWLIADRRGAVTAEPTAAGLQIHENPVEVLTNSPPFPQQMAALGGDGLPGDGSSTARFLRAVFTRSHALSLKGEAACVGQVFHIIGAVAQVKGCRVTEEGYPHTLYTACCNADRGIYYVTTYGCRRIHAVCLHRGDPDGEALARYPLPREETVAWQN